MPFLEGAEDPVALALLARGRLREKRPELEKAVVGGVTPHRRFLASRATDASEFLDEAVERASGEIEGRVRPFEEDLVPLDSIPAGWAVG